MNTMFSTASSGAPGVLACSDLLLAGVKAGPWIVERELGRGGMGAVYAVVHEEIGKRAALKVVHRRLLGPGFNSDRMLLEARVVNQVGHPNIIDIFETGKLADGRPYIVMERLDGQSLSARAEEGKLLPDLVIALLLQMCDALIAAHAAGVVHRDLKLDNVFLVVDPEDPTTPRVKLLDWGIAKVMSHDVKQTIDGELVGTPQYLSPEQACGQDVTPQTDVYSLGVMTFELFLEALPFEAATAAEVMTLHLRAAPPRPRELWPDIPPPLEALMLEMLAKQPHQRPTMLEVARRLDAIGRALERRRHAPEPRTTAAGESAARSNRALGFAGTAYEDVTPWRASPRRWPYAVGGLALLGLATALWVGRLGDHTASAAVGGSAMTSVHSSDIGARAPQPTTPRSELPVTAPAEPTAPAPVASPRAVESTEPSTSQRTPVARPRPSSSSASERPTTVTRPLPAPSPSARPRRDPKIDRDGTMDPYR